MSIAAAKQVVAAGNLANVNTPGYHARAVDFTAALERQMGGPLAGTSGGHLEGTITEAVATGEEVDGLQQRRDGNTVGLDHELLTMTARPATSPPRRPRSPRKFRLVRYAINEGR